MQPNQPSFLINNYYYGAPPASNPPVGAHQAARSQYGASPAAYPDQIAGSQTPFVFYPAPIISPLAHIEAEIGLLTAEDYSVCERINQIRETISMFTDFLNRRTEDMHRAYDTWQTMGQFGAQENQKTQQWHTYLNLCKEVESNVQHVADCNEEIKQLVDNHQACIYKINMLQQQRFAAMAGYPFPQQPALQAAPPQLSSFPPFKRSALDESKVVGVEEKKHKVEETVTFGSFSPVRLKSSDGLKTSPKRKLCLSSSSEGTPNVDEFFPINDAPRALKKRAADDKKAVVVLSAVQQQLDEGDSADTPLSTPPQADAVPAARSSYASKLQSISAAPVAALQPARKPTGDELTISPVIAPSPSAYYNTDNKKLDKTGLGEEYRDNLRAASYRHVQKRLELFKAKCLLVHRNQSLLEDYTIVHPFKAYKYYSPAPYDTQPVGERQRAHISVIPQIRIQHSSMPGDFEIQGKTGFGTKKVAVENLLNVCDITERVINIIDGILEIKVRKWAIDLLNDAAAGGDPGMCASQFALGYHNALEDIENDIDTAYHNGNLPNIFNRAFAQEDYQAIKACISGMRNAVQA